MINKDKAHEVRDGLIVNTFDSGNTIEGPFYTGGPSSPVGVDLPSSTFYVQNPASGKVIIWQKVGVTVNDWRQLSAEDIPFDPSTSDLTGTDVQTALQALANRHFGKELVYRHVTSFTTTSTTYQTALDFSGALPEGTYRLQYGFAVTNSKTNTNSTTQVLINGGVEFERSQEGITSNSILSFNGSFVHPGGTFTGGVQIKRDTGNGQAELSSIKGELWRLA